MTFVAPAPVIPDYRGPNVCGIVPGLLGPAEPPEWFPEPLRDAHQVALLVLDGLGWLQLQARLELAPTLSAMSGGPITTVVPSTTSTALTSIATGLTPGEHGIVGYRIDVAGEPLNVLRWSTPRGDARRTQPPREMQPHPPFLGTSVPVVSRADLEGSGFTEAHLRGVRHVGWRTASGLAVEVGHQLRAGEPFVYAYYDGIDKIAHDRGFGDFYDAELTAADHLVRQVLDRLPAGAALAVTADHGQVHVGDRTLPPDPAVLRLVARQSGEGRFRWLHARPGAARELAEVAHDAHADVAWVVTKERVLDEQWFGPVVSPPVAARLGDVALVAHAPVSFEDPLDTGPFQLVCRHGSLTADEMQVPLLASGVPS